MKIWIRHRSLKKCHKAVFVTISDNIMDCASQIKSRDVFTKNVTDWSNPWRFLNVIDWFWAWIAQPRPNVCEENKCHKNCHGFGPNVFQPTCGPLIISIWFTGPLNFVVSLKPTKNLDRQILHIFRLFSKLPFHPKISHKAHVFSIVILWIN